MPGAVRIVQRREHERVVDTDGGGRQSDSETHGTSRDKHGQGRYALPALPVSHRGGQKMQKAVRPRLPFARSALTADQKEVAPLVVYVTC